MRMWEVTIKLQLGLADSADANDAALAAASYMRLRNVPEAHVVSAAQVRYDNQNDEVPE